MSDDVEIRSGGAIAVDTVSLEAAAQEAGLIARTLEEAAAQLDRAVALLDLDGLAWGHGRTLAGRADAAAAEGRERQRRLQDAAAGYELVELQAQRAVAEASGDTAAVGALDARAAAVIAEHPAAAALARSARSAWEDGWDDEFLHQALQGARLLGPGASTAAQLTALLFVAAIRHADLGRIRPGSVLHGGVVVPPMTAHAAGTGAAPASLAEMAARIPPGPDRVRVERYAMPDGTSRFAVYVAGTQAWDGDEPWDMTSNVQLYTGQLSDSYVAVAAALKEAGAEPGDVVYATGHSQGAIIASRLAMEGGYDTRLLATFGSPVEAPAGEDTLSVQVRHRDDPVSLLAGPGSAVPVGAAGGFVAERTVDPLPGFGDLQLGAHQLSAYEETARIVDGSGDPRTAALHDRLAELAGVPAEVTTWSPEVSRAGEGGG